MTRKDSSSKSSEEKKPVERKPHRSGQEYEYGETPETGLGGGGVGADPRKAHARHSEQPASDIAREQQPVTPTRQNGGGERTAGSRAAAAATAPRRRARAAVVRSTTTSIRRKT